MNSAPDKYAARVLDADTNWPSSACPVVLDVLRGETVERSRSVRCGFNTVTRSVDGRSLTIDIPLTSTDPMYFRRAADSSSLRISDDPRALRTNSCAIDERSLFSILQFGAIVPPLSLWRGIQRLAPGASHTLHVDDLTWSSSGLPLAVVDTACSDATMGVDAQASCVSRLLDEVLDDLCPNHDPVILFSGGVDSGLIALRAAQMGWKDTLLLHYSMADDDPETIQARAMAQQIGLPIRCVQDIESKAMAVLGQAARAYPQPFGDHSTLPSFALARATIAVLDCPRVIIDGTGADGCFGMFAKAAQWRGAYHLPRGIRNLASAAYAWAGQWRRPGELEKRLRILRRTASLPWLSAAIAQNPLSGLAYQFPQETTQEVCELLEKWSQTMVVGDEPDVRLPALDLALVCANIFAQKNKPVFAQSTHRVAYPFLDERIVGLALGHAACWPYAEQSKFALKAALAQHVPQEMVFRRKSGFVAPLSTILRDPTFLAAFDRILAKDSPLAPYLNLRVLRQLRRDVETGRDLPAQTYNLIWSAIFTNCWCEQSRDGASTSSGAGFLNHNSVSHGSPAH